MSTNEPRCIYCQGPLEEPIFRDVRDRLKVSPRTWTFRRCRVCGSAVLDPMPSLEELITAYPEHYSFDQASQTRGLHRVLYWLETSLFYHRIYQHSVRQVLQITGLRQGRLLDVGGGSGHRTRFFQKAGFECTVLDVDERPLQIARERFGLRTICGVLEQADLPPESFDIITFYAVIEHLPDPRSTLQAAHRILRTGGWLVALVPVLTGWENRWFRFLGMHQIQEAPRHVGLPTLKGMAAMLSACGFDLQAHLYDHVLDDAGIMALSLLPQSASAIACSFTHLLLRGLYRMAGGALTLLLLPIAWTMRRFHYSINFVFFAKKIKF
jgi:SAM-dependent methyltransferase